MSKRKVANHEIENRRKFFAYISPWLIGFCFFTIVPMTLSLIFSFTNVKMSTVNSDPWTFIGLKNYADIFTKDSDFKRSILNTFIYAGIKVSLLVIFALLIALLLNKNIIGRKAFRVLIYLPAVIPVVSVSLLWKLIFTGDQLNIVNYYLSYLGIAPVNFFGNDVSAMGTVIFVGIWSGLGPTMLIFLAAIQGISKEMIEASELDGVNPFQELIYIIIPTISKAIMFVVLTTFISSLQAYAEVELLTAGGPGIATTTMSMLIVKNAFKTLGNKTLGYACAQGWIVFFITFIFGIIYVKMSTKKEKKINCANGKKEATK